MVSHKNPVHLISLWASRIKYPHFFLEKWPFHCPKTKCKFMPLALLNVMLHFFFLQQWKFSNVCHTIGMKKIHSSLPKLQVPDLGHNFYRDTIFWTFSWCPNSNVVMWKPWAEYECQNQFYYWLTYGTSRIKHKITLILL